MTTSTKDQTMVWHSDPSHAWLEVSIPQLCEAGLILSDLSIYSYRQGSTLYLEEDYDAPLYLQSSGRACRTIERHLRRLHWIRLLPRVKDRYQ